MTWNNVKLPFGLINDRLKHIDDVPNGRSCGCRCPKCNRLLEARNAGKIRAHYFAHYDSDECTGATETAVHSMAKQIIADAKIIKTPLFEKIPQHKDIEENTHYGESVRIGPKLVNAEYSYPEDRRQGYTPDVTLITKNRHLLVEIKVTHEVDFDKQLKVENNNEAMMEIDLSDVDSAMLLEMPKFEQYVIHDAPRHWIHNPQGNARYDEEMVKLRNRVAELNIELHKKIKARIEKERQQKKKLLEYETRKTQEREKYAEKFGELELYQSPEWRRQRELTQQHFINNFPEVLKIKEAEQAYGLSPLIDMEVKNAWIFNFHKSIWQAYILNTFVFGGNKGKELNVWRVIDSVVSKFGMLDVVSELYDLKQSYKKIGRERNKWYKDSGCWFFSQQENKAIPSPYLPVIEYLKYLEKLGFIESGSDNLFSVVIENFDQYIDSAHDEKKRQQYKWEKEVASQQAQLEKQAIAKKELKEESDRISKQKKLRQKEIMASEQRIFELFDGEAHQCKKCKLLSHQNDSDNCPFCGYDELEKTVITAYHIEKAIHRYNCSPYPGLSLEALPAIKNRELLAEWLLKVPDL